MVIVGAGEAGARAAVALRDAGWRHGITLIGAERHLPYERPPLSKAVMTAADPAAPTTLSAADFQRHDITFARARVVTKIDRVKRQVRTDDGRQFGYERLLLATGAAPRLLSVPGATRDTVLYLRSFDDALALRTGLKPGARIAIIGGGFIGLELAASAQACGCRVTLIELGERLLMRGVPAEIAERLTSRHRLAGIDLRLGTAIDHIETLDTRRSIILSDGQRIECDVILAGIGATPSTGLAAKSGLEVENGIRVDGALRTSDPDIFAAGDCCSFPHRLYAGRRIRLEAWRNAIDQAAIAARNMLGATETYDAVPWFWSDQYDLCLQIAGLPDEGSEIIARRLDADALLLFHLARDGRLVAASGIGPTRHIGKEIRLAEMLIAKAMFPDRAQLAAAEVKLKALLA